MNFKEAFKFPLSLTYGKVFTANHAMAFDFPHKILCGDEPFVKLSEDSQERLVDLLNGTGSKPKTKLDLSYENGNIYITIDSIKSIFIVIRGWGFLTGTGGLHLDGEVAGKIQDDFAEYIITTLKNTD